MTLGSPNVQRLTVEPVTLSGILRHRADAEPQVWGQGNSRTITGYESGTRFAVRRRMINIHRFRRLVGAAAHLCQVEADLVAAGYPELVGKLDDIRTQIDLEICYLEDRSELSRSY